MVATEKDIIASLERASAKIRQQKRETESEYKNHIKDLDRREKAVSNALDALRASSNGKRATSSKKIALSISPERFEKVQQYLQKQGRAKQTALVDELKLNSGTISVALKKLEQEGKARNTGEKQDGSQVWETLDDGRETVVQLGKGTHRGRRRTKQAA
jgi:DNA-binding MarR family transcriptional regulator